MRKLIAEKLNEFLDERLSRFPKVSKKQKDIWVKALESEIASYLDDNEIFYTTRPDDIIEYLTGN
jgi:hypothetical protein